MIGDARRVPTTRLPALVLALLGALLLSAATGMTTADSARAATYTVYGCSLPDGRPAPIDGWQVEQYLVPMSTAENRCATGQGLVLRFKNGEPHHQDDFIQVGFDAPADTAIAAYGLWRSVQLAPGTGYFTAIQQHTGEATEKYDECAGCTVGNPDVAFAPGNWVARTATRPFQRLRTFVSCAAATPCPAIWGLTGELRLFGAAVELKDDFAPQLATPTGPLVEPGRILAGSQPVSVAATDRGGGVAEASLEVDGKVAVRQVVDSNNGRCERPFTTPVPCKLSAGGTLSLDTATLSDPHPHQLRLLVTDATGANTVAWGPITIVTANGSCSPEPELAGQGRVEAWLGRSRSRRGRSRSRRGRSRSRRGRPIRRKRVTVPYGRRVRVSGRVTGADGAPLAGATVCLVSQSDASGAGLRREESVVTRADGRFSARLATGTTRDVWALRRLSGGAIADQLRVFVRAKVTARPSRDTLRNGQRFTVSGRVPGPIPRGGVLVALQARRGARWQPFALARTNRRGRYKMGYRFTRTTGVQRYRLRTFVPPQSGYPYNPKGSRSLTVRVRG